MTYPIPDEALDDRLAVVGTAGAGKTYAVLGALGRLMKRGSRFIAADALGVMWGLRLKPDGEQPSEFKPVIFGGPHADLPLSVMAAPLIGETAAGMAESLILDLSELGSKNAERRFMLGFLTALYRHANKEPVHLIFDEADLWAPQRLLDKEGESAKLLGMMDNIVRRGRVKGFIPWLITQRPAVLSKDVLSQADGVVAMKLTSSQDRDAIGAWIEGQADRAKGKETLALLPTMDRGAGVVWIPGRQVLAISQFPANRTFDSSRTPKRGEMVQRVDLKPLDLGKLKDRLAKVEAEVKANDPAALKAQVASLQAELRKKRPATAAGHSDAEVDAAYKAGWDTGWTCGWEAGAEEGMKATKRAIRDGIATVAVGTFTAPPSQYSKKFVPLKLKRVPKMTPFVDPKNPISDELLLAMRAPPRPGSNAISDLPRPQARVLQSVAFWKSVGTEEPSRAQVAGVAGYSPNSGGFGNLIGQLVTAGMIRLPRPGHVALEDGAPYVPMTPHEAKVAAWGVLTGPQQKLLMAALGGTGPITREELASLTDYSPSSGGFGNLIGQLCTLTIFEKPAPGMVALSGWAREVMAV